MRINLLLSTRKQTVIYKPYITKFMKTNNKFENGQNVTISKRGILVISGRIIHLSPENNEIHIVVLEATNKTKFPVSRVSIFPYESEITINPKNQNTMKTNQLKGSNKVANEKSTKELLRYQKMIQTPELKSLVQDYNKKNNVEFKVCIRSNYIIQNGKIIGMEEAPIAEKKVAVKKVAKKVMTLTRTSPSTEQLSGKIIKTHEGKVHVKLSNGEEVVGRVVAPVIDPAKLKQAQDTINRGKELKKKLKLKVV